MTQPATNDAGARERRSAVNAIIANTATDLAGKRENGTMPVDMRPDIRLGRPTTRPPGGCPRRSGRIG